MEKLPLPKRLAFMSGHVKAGIELYRLNELEMAAPHLMHPVSETHESERRDLDKLGFNQSLFKEITHALEKNVKSGTISTMLVEAEKNIDALSENAGGNPYEIIEFLMVITLEEYELSFKDGTIIELGEYQDAWGFLRVVETEARQMTESDDPDIAAAGREILAHLEPTGTAFGDLQGKGSFTMDPSILMGAAARIEITGLGLI